MAAAMTGTDEKKIHGGSSAESTNEHFSFRFCTGASRLTYLLVDPEGKFSEEQRRILQSLAGGRIALLDIACGAGAATSALLSTVSEMRAQQTVPTLPLNINIYGVDFSDTALSIFQSVLQRLYRDLSSQGIHFSCATHRCDLTVVEQMNDVCDAWFAQSPISAIDEYIVMVANISGVPKEIWGAAGRSISHAVERISNKPSSVLWIEPGTKDAKSFLERVLAVVFGGLKAFIARTDKLGHAASYDWSDQVTSKIVPSQVRVVRYNRSY